MFVVDEQSIKYLAKAPEAGTDRGQVPLAMELDEAFNPVEVSLLGAEGILLEPNSVADAVWQADPLLPGLGSTVGPLPDDFRGLSTITRWAIWTMDALFSVYLGFSTSRQAA